MPSSSSAFWLAALMVAGGVGIPIMAALTSQLGVRIGSPWVATFVLFLVAALAAGVTLAVVGPPQRLSLSAPPHYFLGGLLVAFYALSIAFAAPRIGIGNAIFFVLLGQIFTAAAIDHFGLFGVARSALTLQRAAGIGFMLVGVFLARRMA